jgi:hypothetical protein
MNEIIPQPETYYKKRRIAPIIIEMIASIPVMVGQVNRPKKQYWK